MIKKITIFTLTLLITTITTIVLLTTTPALTEIKVYFSPEQGENILSILQEAIQGAKERIYILIYSFTLDELADALIKAKDRGIEVKIIMDKTQAEGSSSVDERLREAGINVKIQGGSKGGYMHIKMMVVDDMLMTGSYNWSGNATNKNDENFLVITNEKEVLESHLVKFNQLWKEELSVTSPKITEITVYITKTGEKYHRLGCSYLSKSCIPISLTEAKKKGYTPCSKCKPPS